MTLRRSLLTSVFLLLTFLGFSLFPILMTSGSRTYQEVVIPAEGYDIHGYISQGKNSAGPWIVFCHGNRKDGQSVELYQYIRKNINLESTVLSINFRGFGGSSVESLAEAENILDRSEDIQASVAYLRENLNASDNRIILIGHSMGAAQVMKVAQESQYALVIPIGLGDWNIVLSDPKEIYKYIEKYYANTGVKLSGEAVHREATSFKPQNLFSNCPETPVKLIFGSQEKSRKTLAPYYQDAQEHCGDRIETITIYSAGHMYGTESYNLPEPLRILKSRVQVSMLLFQVNRIIDDY